MNDLAAAQAALGRVRGAAMARPDCERLHVAELELTVRVLRIENRELRQALRSRRPIIVRRAS